MISVSNKSIINFLLCMSFALGAMEEKEEKQVVKSNNDIQKLRNFSRYAGLVIFNHGESRKKNQSLRKELREVPSLVQLVIFNHGKSLKKNQSFREIIPQDAFINVRSAWELWKWKNAIKEAYNIQDEPTVEQRAKMPVYKHLLGLAKRQVPQFCSTQAEEDAAWNNHYWSDLDVCLAKQDQIYLKGTEWTPKETRLIIKQMPVLNSISITENPNMNNLKKLIKWLGTRINEVELLYLTQNNIQDISGINKFKNAWFIELQGNKNLKSLNGSKIEQLPRLKRLCLENLTYENTRDNNKAIIKTLKHNGVDIFRYKT